MLYIFARTLRTPTKQWTQTILRSYSYKPVERKFGKSSHKKFGRLNMVNRLRQVNTEEFTECDFDLNRFLKTPEPDNGWSMYIIEGVPSNVEALSVPDMLAIFEQLSVNKISDDVLLHENFNTLIDSVKLNEPFLSTSKLVCLFTHICHAEVPMFDELTEFIVNALLQRITFFTIDDIINVDFAIRKYYAREGKLSKLFEKLRQMTRASFNDMANNELGEPQTYDKLIRMLKYLGNNRSLMERICSTNLIGQLLLKEDNEFCKNDAACVIVTLARLPSLNDSKKELLTKAFRIWCNRANSTHDVKAILKRLFEKKIDGIDLSPFQNIDFIEHCTKLAIQNADITTALDILNGFNEMNWTSTDLIEFVSTVFDDCNDESEQCKELRSKDYAILCTACVIANYKPHNWESKMVAAIERAPTFGIDYHKQIDYALTLNKLGIYQNELIENLMKSTEIQQLHKHNPKLHEVYRTYGNDDEKYTNWSRYAIWLMSDLEKFLGPKKVLSNVIINKDVTVPIVMKVNIYTGEFIDMNANTIKKDLICKNHELIIGIPGCVWTDMAERYHVEIQKKQAKQMKKMGWAIIKLEEQIYGASPVFRRAFIFFRTVLWAINERNVR